LYRRWVSHATMILLTYWRREGHESHKKTVHGGCVVYGEAGSATCGRTASSTNRGCGCPVSIRPPSAGYACSI